jgi:hypothetical protein
MTEVSLQEKSPKQKLTLTVSKDVILQAREAGINISDITEKLLTVIAFKTTEGNTFQAVQRSYKAVFEYVSYLLSIYGAESFEVGIHPRVVDNKGNQYNNLPIYYDQFVWFHVWVEGTVPPICYEFQAIQDYLHPIMQVLENLFQTLTVAAKENKERISELTFALRLVQALSKDKENKNER